MEAVDSVGVADIQSQPVKDYKSIWSKVFNFGILVILGEIMDFEKRIQISNALDNGYIFILLHLSLLDMIAHLIKRFVDFTKALCSRETAKEQSYISKGKLKIR